MKIKESEIGIHPKAYRVTTFSNGMVSSAFTTWIEAKQEWKRLASTSQGVPVLLVRHSQRYRKYPLSLRQWGRVVLRKEWNP